MALGVPTYCIEFSPRKAPVIKEDTTCTASLSRREDLLMESIRAGKPTFPKPGETVGVSPGKWTIGVDRCSLS